MKTQREILNAISISIIKIIPQGEKFQYAILEIKRLPGNVGFTGYYINDENTRKWLDIFNIDLNTDIIEELYTITQNDSPKHKNWNRAKFTLYSEGRFEMEYIWDEILQNEVDRFNDKKTTADIHV